MAGCFHFKNDQGIILSTNSGVRNNLTRVKNFFASYETRFNNALSGKDEIEATANAFTSNFIEANPHGAYYGKNDKQFRQAIEEGYKYYRRLGMKEMSIRSLKTSQLDDYHYISKVLWHSVYLKENKSVVIDFSVVYLLQDIDHTIRIFAYAPGDEQAALKEHGLI